MRITVSMIRFSIHKLICNVVVSICFVWRWPVKTLDPRELNNTHVKNANARAPRDSFELNGRDSRARCWSHYFSELVFHSVAHSIRLRPTHWQLARSAARDLRPLRLCAFAEPQTLRRSLQVDESLVCCFSIESRRLFFVNATRTIHKSLLSICSLVDLRVFDSSDQCGWLYGVRWCGAEVITLTLHFFSLRSALWFSRFG